MRTRELVCAGILPIIAIETGQKVSTDIEEWAHATRTGVLYADQTTTLVVTGHRRSI